MAIAITLLILEVRIPVGSPNLGKALTAQWPAYLAYVTSFLTLGIIWANHHRMFKLIDRTTHGFIMINVLFLMAVSFIPFPTALVADYLKDPDQRMVAALVYGASMTVVAIMFNVVWGYASAGHRLLVGGLDPEVIRKRTRGYHLGPVAYGGATLLALVSPIASLVIYAALAVFYTLPFSGPG